MDFVAKIVGFVLVVLLVLLIASFVYDSTGTGTRTTTYQSGTLYSGPLYGTAMTMFPGQSIDYCSGYDAGWYPGYVQENINCSRQLGTPYTGTVQYYTGQYPYYWGPGAVNVRPY